MSLESNYNPKLYEDSMIRRWGESHVGEVKSQLDNNPDLKETHSILMPPPNLTGVLHAGHAFQHFLMDTISRIERQNGKLNLWQPGVDHAGIQLEGVIDKLFKSGEIEIIEVIKNHENFPSDIDDLPKFLKTNFRDFWLENAWLKVNEWRDIQKQQSSVLGDTPDYSRSLFTLDKQAVDMVNHAFVKYWNDGLIYKKSYMINWSVGLQTALSDVSEDIGYETRKDPFITINYKLCSLYDNEKNGAVTDRVTPRRVHDKNGKDLTLEVTTVRPETIFSDQFLLVNREASNLSQELKELFESFADREDYFYAEIPLQGDDEENKVYIPVVFTSDNSEVDPEFGTGVLKVTPAHDQHDYDLYHKYNKTAFKIGVDRSNGVRTKVQQDPFTLSVEKSGKLTEITDKYQGKKVEQARRDIILDLIENGFVSQSFESDNKKAKYISNYLKLDLEKVIECKYSEYKVVWDYEHNVTICERSKTVVEPLISEEFFLSYHTPTSRDNLSLAQLAKSGISETEYFSSNFREMADNFIDNIHDWCISRDLVWGHSMPIWYNLDTNPSKIFYNKNDIVLNSKLESHFQISSTKPEIEGIWVQEDKILDTWFSSCLWPLSTLGYIDAVKDVEWSEIPKIIENKDFLSGEKHDFFKFYSTDEMITAREIFYAWVVRMTMLGKYFTGKVPFRKVVITPTVQDEKGRKMSKSLGNGLDPQEAIQKYSSDSLRLAMLAGMYPNRNIKMGGVLADNLLEKYRNFGNKLWNVARFLKQK
jgi:valyl-tRNA synthetase